MVDFSRCLQPKEVAPMLGLSGRQLTNWLARGQGPSFYKIGRRYYYEPEEVQLWIANQRDRGRP